MVETAVYQFAEVIIYMFCKRETMESEDSMVLFCNFAQLSHGNAQIVIKQHSPTLTNPFAGGIYDMCK